MTTRRRFVEAPDLTRAAVRRRTFHTGKRRIALGSALRSTGWAGVSGAAWAYYTGLWGSRPDLPIDHADKHYGTGGMMLWLARRHGFTLRYDTSAFTADGSPVTERVLRLRTRARRLPRRLTIRIAAVSAAGERARVTRAVRLAR